MSPFLILSIITSFAALGSGIAAVGSGQHWQFRSKDIFKGRENAVLYVWVTFSTIFSLLHLIQQIVYGLDYNGEMRAPDSARWFILHAFMGFLMISAHVFVFQSLRKSASEPDRFLWGKLAHA
jgi:hypothetical protein